MENNNIEYKELSPEKVKEMLLGIRYIFVNYPPDRLKEIIWQLYRGWVYNSAEWAQEDDIRDMLLFYDFITHLIDDLFEYSQYLDRPQKDIVALKNEHGKHLLTYGVSLNSNAGMKFVPHNIPCALK